ncbi:MAG: exodeoxyribonuclease III [Flavobacteriales bacterium]|nr:exodeoxyribonuclease III [Flavobacteriales bacterium]
MKIISWNVNGVRAIMKKGFAERVAEMNPDILCLQETKAQDDQVAEALSELQGWHLVSNSAVRKGYSGTAILSRQKPLSTSRDIGIDEHDQEGRVVVAEFDSFQVVCVYVPNSGNGLARLDYRSGWDKDFQNYLVELDAKKPIIVVGDLNVAHQPIDIARPKSNYNKTAGYTQVEIDGMTSLLNAGFTDSFRHLYPDTVKYSWWSFRGGAREKNIGWRIDYSLVSSQLLPSLKDAFILNEMEGSDHCPVGVVIER